MVIADSEEVEDRNLQLCHAALYLDPQLAQIVSHLGNTGPMPYTKGIGITSFAASNAEIIQSCSLLTAQLRHERSRNLGSVLQPFEQHR